MSKEMQLPTSFESLLITLAGGPKKRGTLVNEFAKAMPRKEPIKYTQVNYWVRTNYVPPQYWNDLVKLAARKKMPLKDVERWLGPNLAYET